mmetsp:Transcript_19041/g.41980  ORF Transcript_19041/g.41980 Transcript_19041/m.41980 type:complete len:228 (+) Transcript_19041:854-1537(+)
MDHDLEDKEAENALVHPPPCRFWRVGFETQHCGVQTDDATRQILEPIVAGPNKAGMSEQSEDPRQPKEAQDAYISQLLRFHEKRQYRGLNQTQGDIDRLDDVAGTLLLVEPENTTAAVIDPQYVLDDEEHQKHLIQHLTDLMSWPHRGHLDAGDDHIHQDQKSDRGLVTRILQENAATISPGGVAFQIRHPGVVWPQGQSLCLGPFEISSIAQADVATSGHSACHNM